MIHLPDLIQDLGFILITAAAVSIICKRLGQPVVLGYLIAGFLVGPHVPFVPTVVKSESIAGWAEFGVIFLLFGLGLEFSFKKLARIGRPATVTAVFEIAFMIATGFLAGRIFDWSAMDSIFLGGILAISSTTIIVRAFDELGMKGRRFVSLVFGVLIVEDLIAVLLLVLLSTLAVTRSLAGGELILAGLRLGFFLLLWFAVGIYLIPLFFRKAHRFLNDETTLVVSIGLCLMMVILAAEVGFSPALGAFVMGSILAETREGNRIGHLIMPVRHLFAAVFFVSVGMLIDPGVLVQYGGMIFLVTLVTIAGKLLSTTLGALLAGQSLRHSLQAGMSLAQIGEFSFIIATLGLTLGVTSDFLYPVAVAVSALTTFTTPYLIRESEHAASRLEAALPSSLRERLIRYQSAFADRHSQGDAASLLWAAYGMKILLNGAVVIGITFVMKKVALPLALDRLGGPDWLPEIFGAFTFLLSFPFFWGVVLGKPSEQAISTAEKVRRLAGFQFGVLILRGLLGGGLLFFLLHQFARTGTATLITMAIFAAVFLLFSRFAEPLYRRVEERFIANLNEKELEELTRFRSLPELAPWDATMAPFTLSPDSDFAGLTLVESRLKENFGLTVAVIDRGKRRIQAPKSCERLMPGDRLYLIGTESQFEAARESLEGGGRHFHLHDTETFGLESVRIEEGNPYTRGPIRESGIREAVNGLIVGVERAGKRILNPESSFRLQPGDLIWVFGDKSKIQRLREHPQGEITTGPDRNS